MTLSMGSVRALVITQLRTNQLQRDLMQVKNKSEMHFSRLREVSGITIV